MYKLKIAPIYHITVSVYQKSRWVQLESLLRVLQDWNQYAGRYSLLSKASGWRGVGGWNTLPSLFRSIVEFILCGCRTEVPISFLTVTQGSFSFSRGCLLSSVCHPFLHFKTNNSVSSPDGLDLSDLPTCLIFHSLSSSSCIWLTFFFF